MGICCRVTKRQILLALSALTIPAAAFAQFNGNWPVRGPVPPPPPPPAVAEPQMAPPAAPARPWRLPAGSKYDAALAARVKGFQAVHAIKPDGVAGAGTIEALNRGAQYYEQIILINLERAKRLPAPEEQHKYLVVDAGDARLSMWEN